MSVYDVDIKDFAWKDPEKIVVSDWVGMKCSDSHTHKCVLENERIIASCIGMKA